MQPLPPYPAPEHREDLFLVLGEQHHRTSPSARADAALAGHSRARPLHRHRSSSAPSARARPRPACIPTSSSSSRIAPSDPARKVGGLVLEVKGDFCQQVRDILRAPRPRRRLRRGQSRLAVPLQPAAQRPRRLRAGLRHRHADDQPVRPRQGAVLAAGEHEPGQVRDPAAPDARRLRDAVPGLRARHQPGQAARQDRGRRATLRAPNHRRIVVDKREHLFTTALQRVDVARRRRRARDVDRLVGGRSRTRSRRRSIPYRDRARRRRRRDGPTRWRSSRP